jgi:hypothetical protein
MIEEIRSQGSLGSPFLDSLFTSAPFPVKKPLWLKILKELLDRSQSLESFACEASWVGFSRDFAPPLE